MSLLIDGHNLIGAMPDIDLADPDDEWQLVVRVRTYCAAKRTTATIVFDSGPGPAPTGRLSTDQVKVLFAPPGVVADVILLQLLRRSKAPSKVTIVTNDQGLAGLVRQAGGQVRSATQFARELARPPRQTGAAAEVRPDPRDPAFADIYRGFVESDKDQARFGAEIDLDAAEWIERLYGDDPVEAARAAHWLGRFGGEPALAPLLDASTHSASSVRAAALLALAALGNRAAVPAVTERLVADSSTMVREAAAQALGRLGGPAAEQALQEALSDPRSKVRRSARASLDQLRARR
jgi:predicted RNA-binding protein with PIN domain